MAVDALNPGFAYILGDLVGGVPGDVSICVAGERSLEWVLRSGGCPLGEDERPEAGSPGAARAGYACTRIPRTIATVDGDREVWVVAPRGARGVVETVDSLCAAASRIEDLEDYRIQLCEELVLSNETLASVYEMGRNPGSFLDYRQAVEQIVERLAMSHPGCAVCVWLSRDGELVPSAWRECQPTTTPADAGVLGRGLASGAGLVANGGAAALGVEPEPLLAGARSLAVVPMKCRDEVVGCLAIWSAEDQHFESRLVGLLSAFGFQTALALENDALHKASLDADRVLRELSIGSEIQRRLLFSKPPASCPFLEFGAISIPSRQIDGDFFEFMHFGEHLVDVFLGDVMGKGLPAALVGAAMKNEFFRAQALQSVQWRGGDPPAPDDILHAMHRGLAPELVRLEAFVTACYARFDVRSAELALVDCGHTKVLHYDAAEGASFFLDYDFPGRVNLPLGMDPGCVFRAKRLPFGPGDVFVFYSDGVTEARAPGGEMFGAERLAELVERHADDPAEELARRVRRAVSDFIGSDRFRDDLTCLVVRALPLGAESHTRPCVLELPALPGRLQDVREFAEGVLERMECLREDEEERSRIVLALVEAAQNVVEHGYPEGEPGTLRIEALARGGAVRFDLTDDGRSFDPRAVGEPVFDGSHDGGFGVYIIRQVMDEFEYCPGEGESNRMRLTWRRRDRS